MPVPESGCWLWMKATHSTGYGWVRDKTKGRNGGEKAHRYAYKLFNGEIPEGLIVRHMCHVRLCCNPSHLKAGTYSENTQDSLRDGRWNNELRRQNMLNYLKNNPHPCLGRQSTPKLTKEQVVEIRQSTLHPKELAKIYNVTHSNINYILQRKTWKNV